MTNEQREWLLLGAACGLFIAVVIVTLKGALP